MCYQTCFITLREGLTQPKYFSAIISAFELKSVRPQGMPPPEPTKPDTLPLCRLAFTIRPFFCCRQLLFVLLAIAKNISIFVV